MARVDVLLTYWGDVELLKKTVGSILSQTEKDWRLLVFDDAYPSKEPAVYVKSLMDNRITYHRHKTNIGITRNFMYALDAARADHFVMMGCDDIMLPNYLEAALTRIGDADFYQPRVDVIDKDGNLYLPLVDKIKRILRPKKSGMHSGQKLATSLCVGNWLYFPSILWKTSSAKKYGFEPQYKIVEDVVLELSLIKNGGKLFLDNATTFQYRRFAQSLSSREKSKDGVRFSEEDEVYDRFAQEFTQRGWKRAARAAKWRVISRLHKVMSSR